MLVEVLSQVVAPKSHAYAYWVNKRPEQLRLNLIRPGGSRMGRFNKASMHMPLLNEVQEIVVATGKRYNTTP